MDLHRPRRKSGKAQELPLRSRLRIRQEQRVAHELAYQDARGVRDPVQRIADQAGIPVYDSRFGHL